MTELSEGMWPVGRNETTNPHWLDPFAIDLDEIFAGKPILQMDVEFDWALVYPVNVERWDPFEIVTMDGAGWTAQLYPPDRLDDLTTEGAKYPIPVCLVAVATGCRSLNGARDVGRPAARSLAGMISSTGAKIIVGRDPLWEGPVGRRDGDIAFLDVKRRIGIPPPTADAIIATLAPIQGKSATRAPAWLYLARYWYSRAWASQTLIDRFTNFWLSLIAVIDARSAKRKQRQRVQDYLAQLGAATGLNPDRVQDLEGRIGNAYDIRNQVFHESRWASVTSEAVVDLEDVTTFILSKETELNV